MSSEQVEIQQAVKDDEQQLMAVEEEPVKKRKGKAYVKKV